MTRPLLLRGEMQEARPSEERATSSAPKRTAAAGAAAAFEEVYLLYAVRLRKIAVRKFHVPIPEVETLVHDVFATYITHVASVRDVERYLVGAICNASRRWLKRADAADELFAARVRARPRPAMRCWTRSRASFSCRGCSPAAAAARCSSGIT